MKIIELMSVAKCFSKIFLYVFRTTRCYTPEESNIKICSIYY
jgi:hypothetical protein